MFSRPLPLFVTLLLVCSGYFASAKAATYSVGLSNVDITPNTSKHLMGYTHAGACRNAWRSRGLIRATPNTAASGCRYAPST